MRERRGQITTYFLIGFVLLIVVITFIFLYEAIQAKPATTQAQVSGDIFSLGETNLARETVGKAFTAGGRIPLQIGHPVCGLAVNATITLDSEASVARIILVDDTGKEYVVFEAYPLVWGTGKHPIADACEETCLLPAVKPAALRVEATGASVTIDSVAYPGTDTCSGVPPAELGARRDALDLAQQKFIIEQLNTNIKREGMHWVAGHTSVSDLTYEEKKRLFTKPDGTVPAELPDLQGFEYYKGGIFELKSTGNTNATTGNAINANAITGNAVDTNKATGDAVAGDADNLPSSWDWRNVHGENWMTPVKDQGTAGTCWAFALVGTLEAQINLYYNQHIDPDLSEQMLADCEFSDFPGAPGSLKECQTPSWGYILDYCLTSKYGLPDEACDPYAAREYNVSAPKCNDTYICADWQSRSWRNGGFNLYELSVHPENNDIPNKIVNVTEKDLKGLLITRGPMDGGILSWGHAMVLVGYSTDSSDGSSIWLFKNSWGTGWGEAGYGRIKLDFNDLLSPTVPTPPFTPPLGTRYQVLCTDKDHDGYCNWGLGSRPATCPASCKPEEDCDDSNSSIGPRDVNGLCLSNVSYVNSCSDSDGGTDYETAGNVTAYIDGYLRIFTDECVDNTTLREWDCNGTQAIATEHSCLSGCFNGACLPAVASNLTTCIDSDGGPDPFTKGIAHGFMNGMPYDFEDYCIGGNGSTRLMEFDCENNTYVGSREIICPEGMICTDGACVNTTQPPPNVTCGGHGQQQCLSAPKCQPGLQRCLDGMCWYCCADDTHTCGSPPGRQCQYTDPTQGYYDPDCAPAVCGGHGEPQCLNGTCNQGLQACINGTAAGKCYYCCANANHVCGTRQDGVTPCQNTDPTQGYYDPDCPPGT
jgi:hypothetical protein